MPAPVIGVGTPGFPAALGSSYPTQQENIWPSPPKLKRKFFVTTMPNAGLWAPDPALVVTLTDALARADAQDWHWQSLAPEAVVQP